jgi:hypothetical protein
MWKKSGISGQTKDESTTHACWITKVTNTHSEYVILIVFPREKLFRERASVLCLYMRRQSCFMISVVKTKSLPFIGMNTVRTGLAIVEQLLGRTLHFQNKIWVQITTSTLASSKWRASETRRLE